MNFLKRKKSHRSLVVFKHYTDWLNTVYKGLEEVISSSFIRETLVDSKAEAMDFL